MKNTDVKRNRVKEYFIQAAKEMILDEGYESISVRKIGDKAGYSYATIYNYFADQNELLWEVKQSLIRDIFSTLQEKNHPAENDLEGIKKGFRIYVQYYIENPNIFKFLYFCDIKKPEKYADESVEDDLKFQEMWEFTFRRLVDEGKISKADTEIFARTLIYAIHGLITLYLSNNTGLNEETIYSEMNSILDYALK